MLCVPPGPPAHLMIAHTLTCVSVAAQMQRSNDYQRRSTLAVARLLPPPLPPCVFARTLGLGFSFAARRRDAACSDRLLACQLCTQS